LRLFRELGINRLSLGVQSFDEAELRFLGRRHTARQTLAAIDLIRSAGFTNLGLDLMYGLPGQTTATWLKTLEQALSLVPEHLSCYQLTIEAGGTPALRTPMARLVARGEISLPDEETQREFFLLTANFLTARGYLHYEISNFARQGPQVGRLCYHACRHNLKYWTRTPYLGLGPGRTPSTATAAGGMFRQWGLLLVFERRRSPGGGGRNPHSGANPPGDPGPGVPDPGGRQSRTIREYPGADAIVAALTKAGLVRVDRDRVIATASGLVVADRLPLDFVD